MGINRILFCNIRLWFWFKRSPINICLGRTQNVFIGKGALIKRMESGLSFFMAPSNVIIYLAIMCVSYILCHLMIDPMVPTKINAFQIVFSFEATFYNLNMNKFAKDMEEGSSPCGDYVHFLNELHSK